jgi:hypothetical protein
MRNTKAANDMSAAVLKVVLNMKLIRELHDYVL